MIQRVRRTSTLVLAAALLAALTACGSDEGGASSAAGNSDVAEGGRLFGTADEATAALGSDAEPGEFPRTVTHALGETEIPDRPERVVVLDGGELDAVLTLGVVPVGLANPEGISGPPSYLADQLEDVTEVGTINSLNLEAIAGLEPDLILGSQLRAEALYEPLAQIAPTVFSIRPGFPWKENFLLIADALGAENQAEQALNDYQVRADEVRGSVDGDPSISLVRFMPDRIRLYGNLSFIGVILDDVDLARPPNQDIDELATEVSTETVSEADADWIFYSSYGPVDQTAEESVLGGPLWSSLTAVQNGQARPVDDEIWFLALGPTGAMLVLDELEQLLSAG